MDYDRFFYYLFSAVLLLILLYPLAFPAMHWDEATYLLGGSWIHHGAVYGRDFIGNKFPLIYLIASVFQHLFNYNFYLFRFVVSSLYFVFAYLLLFSLDKNIFKTEKPWKIQLLVLLILLVPIFFQVYPFFLTELPALFFLLFVFSYAFPDKFSSLHHFKDMRLNYFFSGIFSGLLVVLRTNFLVPLVVFYLALLFLRKDKFVILASFGALIPIFLAIFCFFYYLPVLEWYNSAYLTGTISLIKLFLSFSDLNYSILSIYHTFSILLLFFFSLFIFFESKKDIFDISLALFSIASILFNSILFVYITPRFFLFSAFALLILFLKHNKHDSLLRWLLKIKGISMKLIFYFILLAYFFSNYVIFYSSCHNEYICSTHLSSYFTSIYTQCGDWISTDTVLFLLINDKKRPVFYFTYYINNPPEAASASFKKLKINEGYCYIIPSSSLYYFSLNNTTEYFKKNDLNFDLISSSDHFMERYCSNPSPYYFILHK